MRKHCTCRVSWYWLYHNIYTDWLGTSGMNFPCLYFAAVQITQYSEMLWNCCSLGFKATWLGLEKVIVGVEVRTLLELMIPERSIGHLFSENWAVDQMGFLSNGTFFWQSRFWNNEPSERRHNSHLRQDPNIPMKNNFLALALFFSFFYSSLTLESGALCKTNPTCWCRVTPHYANSVHPRVAYKQGFSASVDWIQPSSTVGGLLLQGIIVTFIDQQLYQYPAVQTYIAIIEQWKSHLALLWWSLPLNGHLFDPWWSQPLLTGLTAARGIHLLTD